MLNFLVLHSHVKRLLSPSVFHVLLIYRVLFMLIKFFFRYGLWFRDARGKFHRSISCCLFLLLLGTLPVVYAVEEGVDGTDTAGELFHPPESFLSFFPLLVLVDAETAELNEVVLRLIHAPSPFFLLARRFCVLRSSKCCWFLFLIRALKWVLRKVDNLLFRDFDKVSFVFFVGGFLVGSFLFHHEEVLLSLNLAFLLNFWFSFLMYFSCWWILLLLDRLSLWRRSWLWVSFSWLHVLVLLESCLSFLLYRSEFGESGRE